MKEWFLKYWAEVACGALVTVVVTLYRRSMAMRSGVRALLRDRIIQSYNFWMSKGYCPIYARDSICDMFEQYKALKGNHGVSDLIEKLLALPTEKPKRTKKSIEA